MKIYPIEESDIPEVSVLAGECFKDDPFYSQIGASAEQRQTALENLFAKSIRICMAHGYAYYMKEGGEYAAFALWFDYIRLKNNYPADYHFIFYGDQPSAAFNSNLRKETEAIDAVINRCTEYLYLLAIAVKGTYRRKGLATFMVESMQQAYPQYNLFSDVSNAGSLKLYEELGFEEVGASCGCTFIRYLSRQDKIELQGKVLCLGVPSGWDIKAMGIDGKKKDSATSAFIGTRGGEIPYFTQSLYSCSEVDWYLVSYKGLLQYQRLINVLFFKEMKYESGGDVRILYVAATGRFPGFCRYKETVDVYRKNKEWELIPDMYVSIPVQYEKTEEQARCSQPEEALIRRLLVSLDFRTNYEAGIPVRTLESHSFKNRIRRFYLGRIKVQIFSECEVAFNGIDPNGRELGEPVEMGMIMAVDTATRCGVLHLVSLSCGLLVTQLLDSVSRNQINVLAGERAVNLYTYLEETFGIQKKGSAKNFLTIADQRSQVSNDMLASILFCETFYEDGIALGKIADPEITAICDNPHGMAQYNYACVYQYSNVLVQLSETFKTGIDERMLKESITLFYIELVLFEEAAIFIANDEIINFLTDVDKYAPKKVLRRIDTILSEHVKSIDFWNIRMNYPSSKKSVDDIRRSFKIENERAILKRNQEQLLMIYNTRSDIVDKAEAILISTIGTIFTILSVMNFVIEPRNQSLIIVTILMIVFILFVYRKFLLKGPGLISRLRKKRRRKNKR